jgi:hypothetical protein
MTPDDRDTIEVLKAEQDFLEKGGYGRSVRTPWQPTSMFQDSPSCLNLGDPVRTHPCNECLLIDFVPEQARNEDVPCHHIPLDATGTTICELDSQENQPEKEEVLKGWLKSTINALESEATK